MLRTNTGIFINVPEESSDRILHPAVIIGARDNTYSARLAESALNVRVGRKVFIYYEHERVFRRQAARIAGILQTEPTWLIGFETVDAGVPAESRQCYRVCTAMQDVTAKLGPEGDCEVLDVSATGFSAVAGRRHPPGAVIAATLDFEDDHYTGSVTVQSIRALGADRFRYGLHCVTDRTIGGTLPRGLQRISMAIQRIHLRRLKGTG